MLLRKFLSASLALLLICCFSSQEAFSQKWKRDKPETLYARNKKKKVTPIFVGIGTKDPSAQFHTTGTVRFQGLTANEALEQFIVADSEGNLYYRHNSPTPNAWLINGNTGTNVSNNFLGTTDANDLAIRTNNQERLRFLSDGKIGINMTDPTAQVEIYSDVEDKQFRVSGAAPSVNFMNLELGENTFGRIGLATLNNNFTHGTVPGDFIVQSLGATASLIFGTTGGGTGNGVERARINSTGYFGISTMLPTAKFHVNCAITPNTTNPSNIRFENLQSGSGNSLVIDANGYVYAGSASNASNAWNLTGNSGTNRSANFLGTTDNIALGIRTNNLERIAVLADGTVGINNAVPDAQLEVSSQTPDHQLRVSGVSPSINFSNTTLGQNTYGRIGLATVNNNFTQGTIPGDFVVQSLGANASMIFGTTGGGLGNGVERARFNPTGYFGISTANPTAKLHVNCAPVAGQTNPSNVRLENLQTGTGSAVVIDANGFVFKSATLSGKEAQDLRSEVETLREEVAALRQLVNSMKAVRQLPKPEQLIQGFIKILPIHSTILQPFNIPFHSTASMRFCK